MLLKMQTSKLKQLSEEKWKNWMGIEGVLAISKILTTLSLFEKKLTAAYGPLLKQMTYTRLRADTIQVIYIEKAEKIKSGEDSVFPANKWSSKTWDCLAKSAGVEQSLSLKGGLLEAN